jgi:branched-subunit amino acid ABC-type transport system permease component/ABC-type branched-subunit amino acid transport system ATPase component
VSQFISLVIGGAVAGSIYAIMAAGLVLTYQTSGIFNFAHGAVAFSAAFLFFQLNQPEAAGGQGLPIAVAAVLTILVYAPLLGWVLDRLMMRNLANAPEAQRIVGTVGLLIALPALCLWVVEQANERFDRGLPTNEQVFQPPGLGPTPRTTWNPVGTVTVDTNQLAVFAGVLVSALVLWVVLRHTRVGLETRAGVDRRALARLRGIDVERMSSISWMLSTTLAALAGVLIAPLFQLDALTYTLLVFASFGAAVFGNLRSLPLAFAGGFAVGIGQNLIQGYAPDLLTDIAGFRTAVAFLLLLALLVVKAGTRRDRATGTVAEERPPPDHRAGLPRWRRWLPWVVAIAGLTVYVQVVADDFWAGLVVRGLALGIVFLSFVVVTGMGGMVSLAQAAFVTAGGFTAGWLVNHQWPLTVPVLMNNGRMAFLTAAVLGAVVAAAVGLLVALPSLRLGGLALALATLAIAFLADQLVFQVDSIRNGSSGWSVDAPSIGPVDFADDRAMAMLLLGVLLLTTWGIHNLQHSATGRAMLAVRSSEAGARSSGISPTRAKLALFGLSAAVAGFGGAFVAAVSSPFTNVTAPAFLGLIWLTVMVTFGVRRPGGAVLGALVFTLMPEVLEGVASWQGAPWSWLPGELRAAFDSEHVPSILFGLAAINLAREPDGILALAGWRMRERRAARAVAPPAEEGPAPAGVPAGAPVGDRTALRVDGLRAGHGEVEILHGIDLRLDAGSVLLLVGPNGAGKSTLADVLGGLLEVREGTIRLDGEDVTGLAPHRRARAGIVVAPEARGIFPGLTVHENLEIWLPEATDRADVYARFAVLDDRQHQLAGQMSGGEQQLLTLASPLQRRPRVLVADEPTLGLAPLAAERVHETIAELRAAGCAVLLVEEQAQRALHLADWVAVLDRGRVVWSGPAQETDAGRIADHYFGAAGT